MTLSFLFTLLLSGAAATANLPPMTNSHECPALAFSQSLVEKDGRFLIKWAPISDEFGFDFVDVHIVLENLQGLQMGVQRNYPMSQTAQKWLAEIKDPEMISALRFSKTLVLKYSFTYCVAKSTGSVDCDTEVFSYRPITFERRYGLVSCPTECGLKEQFLPVSTQCIGSDGGTYPDMECSEPLPEPVFCEATAPCVTHHWEALEEPCPTECGLFAITRTPDAVCVGSDGEVYPSDLCSDLPRPQQQCPATATCVTHGWQAMPVACPMECGHPYKVITPEAVCMGSDGEIYPSDLCSGFPRPQQECQATAVCVTYFWQEEPALCPTECGLQASMVTPPAVCMGDDGQIYSEAKCANLPMPRQACPATPACITYGWRVGLAPECPTDCGLPAKVVSTPASCVGSDGYGVPDQMCYDRPQEAGFPPADTVCPATERCLDPLKPYCHPIKYKHTVERVGPSYNIVFTPYGQDINRRWIDWVDVHYSVQDMNGNKIYEQENHRMARPQMNTPDLNWTWMATGLALAPGQRLAYSFTYCVEKIDCDTRTYYFSSTGQYGSKSLPTLLAGSSFMGGMNGMGDMDMYP